jgi:hypothetical protein
MEVHGTNISTVANPPTQKKHIKVFTTEKKKH